MHSYLKGKKPYDLPFTPDIKWKLDIVETLFRPCPQVVEATRAAVSDMHRYPALDDLHELTSLVRDYCAVDVEPLFTAGSDSALKLIADTYFTAECDVVIVTPTYPHFIQMAECTPSRIRTIECHSERDIVDRLDQFAGAGVIYICTPNLPLGYESPGAVRQLLARYPDTLVIADEAYIEYGADHTDPNELAGLVSTNRLIVTRTFSKCFGLAALRIGYILCAAERRAELSIMHNGKTVTKVATAAASAALRNQHHFASTLSEYRLARDYLDRALPAVVGDQITGYNLQCGNFFLIYARDPAMVTRSFAQLASVAVRDKSSELAGAIRISIAPVQVMQMVVRVIRHINRYPGVHWLADLDGTLRRGSKLTDPVSQAAREFITTRPVTVVTNNTVHTVDQIRHQLGADIPVIQPQAPVGYFQIARAATNVEPPGGWRGVAVMNSVLDVGSDTWAAAATLIEQSLPVAVVETTWATELRFSSECDSAAPGRLPDAGSLLNAAGSWRYGSATVIGKPNIDVPVTERTVVIGDSDTDRQLAKKIGAEFILVDRSLDRVVIDEHETRIPDISAIGHTTPDQ